MKQRISVEDAQQLTPEQQEKLKEWWQPGEGDYYILPAQFESYSTWWVLDKDLVNKEYATPLLSIGQCLCILERYAPMLGMKHGMYGSWHLEIWTEKAHRMFEDRECIGVLWQAVKEIL